MGRIAPRDGVRRLAGTSQWAVVVARLTVGEGDTVKAGQVVAVLEPFASAEAALARARAAAAAKEAARAARRAQAAALTSEEERVRKLSADGVVADAALD